MKKILLFITLLIFFHLSVSAEKIKSINLPVAGTLADSLGLSVIDIEDLSISGLINGTDIGVIRNLKTLKILNLSNAEIVAGGSSYGASFTQNNVVGPSMFKELTTLTQIILPPNIISIEREAFRGCTSLEEVNIPSSTTSIATLAFCYCPKLKEINLPSSITKIEKSCFASCESLQSIIIPENVTYVGQFAFSSCNSLRVIRFPDKVKTIGLGVLQGCNKLEEIIIGNGISTIPAQAFLSCQSLKKIILGESVSSITITALNACDSISEYIVAESNIFLKSLDGVLYSKDGKKLVSCPSGREGKFIIPEGVETLGYAFTNCKKISEIDFPTTLKTIGSLAFNFCQSITKITLPNSVTTIEGSAFSDCTSLTEITLSESLSTISYNAFDYCSNLQKIVSFASNPPAIYSSTFKSVNKTTCTLFVPKGSFAKYYTANYWSDFKNIIEGNGATNIDNTTNSIIKHSYNSSTKELTLFNIPNGQILKIFNLMGNCVFISTTTYPETVVRLKANGIFIIQVGEFSQKIKL